MIGKELTLKNVSKDLAKQIIKMLLVFIFILLLFVLFNLFFILVRNIEYYHLEEINYLRIGIQILIGLVFIICSLIFVRSYILVNTISLVYRYLTPFFRKLSMVITNKVYDKSLDLSQTKHISKTLDVGSILKNTYERKIPRIIQKGVGFLINQIPFADFVINIKDELKKEDSTNTSKEQVNNLLYNQMNNYIQNSIFSSNNLYWVLWLFPLNVVVQVLLDIFY